MRKSRRPCGNIIVFAALILYFLIPCCPAMAEKPGSVQKERFRAYENEIYDLIDRGLKPLEKLENNDKLTAALSSAGEAFGKTSSDFSKVKVPDEFPQETKEVMKEINHYFAMGLSGVGTKHGLLFPVPKIP
ncbi:hypothetical protein NDK47_11385 [Brevibacillus ruminantium]|uniref:Uncharacterized protein n=1 Tax=Brevibacillus ruminantium TaxID=2950604 RepID=A0ABY4WL08_9BACL|nr:hypothetical protein [Brevibacillus ruminantium]USG67836.1 hypothetical protein NDK47_11385 [Brevibacillus ruminantium]